ncbi:MAG: SDR family oxidoreductase [Burkholderiaceae bacterium]|nr:SDR family oxidoreductase [Rhodoferax sp.]MCP5286225.1 SDR family oxidoreductase [Burkholderiaceae bacterium]
MIVVTGASRGLGRAIAERLLASGRPVVGLARQPVDAPFEVLPCDVADADAVKAAAQALKRHGEPVEALINAAGIASMNLALTTPAAVAQRIVQTNLLGTIFCCQQFAPLIVRRKAGAIVNFSTIAVALGLKGESVYAASKAGVEAFSRVFAREMADFGVNVNCIAPGPIETDLIKGVPAASIARIVAQQVIPKPQTPAAVCDLVELLLDPRSASLSGQVLHVGGA